MYTVLSFGEMASDALRMDAHARAIAHAVKPGDVVIDIGAGTGVLTLLALRAGARRVHAIDPNPAVWLAADLAAENGWPDRVVVHDTTSFEVDLAERADVVVSDLRGSFPVFGTHVHALADAKERLLKPGGVLVPASDALHAAIVECDPLWLMLERGWGGIERHGFRAEAARIATLNNIYYDSDAAIDANQVLTTASQWAEIRYGDPAPSTVESTFELIATRDGVAHAIALWFTAILADGIEFTNPPGHRMVYKRRVLPLLEPARLARGASVKVTLRVSVRGDRCAWDTELPGGKKLRQSTFLGAPTSPGALLRASASFVPQRSARGERLAQTLAAMDGVRTGDEIAETVAAASPGVARAAVVEDVRDWLRHYAR